MYTYTIATAEGKVKSQIVTDAPAPVPPPTKTYRSLRQQLEKEARKVGA